MEKKPLKAPAIILKGDGYARSQRRSEQEFRPSKDFRRMMEEGKIRKY